jgi:transcriptional regulator with XRE-family HTH domain
MADEWGQLIARLVETNGGKQGRTARLIGVPQQTVGRWLKGATPDPEMIRKVARVTNHSLPYLMSVAYGIPIEEMADGVGADVLPYDHQITVRKLRQHIADQYIILRRTPPDGDDEDE